MYKGKIKLKSKSKKINFKAIIFLFVAILFTAQIFYSYGISSSTDKNGQDNIFIIEAGEGVNQISYNLYEAGLIKSKFYFEVYVWREKIEGDLQAGEYVLNPGMSIKEITRVLTEGETLNNELTIKIIEGWKIDEINDYLKKSGIIEGDEFSEYTKNPIGAWRYVVPDFFNDAPSNVNLEGYLFPDTYRIFKDASTVDITKKMLNNFDSKLTDKMRSDIKSQGKTIYEIVTMASIIEEEVRSQEDMKIVSGIFWNRIESGQALESCATLAYILGVNKQQYSIEDTKTNSPYNTYQNRGLPPGPISNPGLNAIQSAIYPEKTDYYYFLSRPDTGETVFAITYDEHLRNKAKYLR